MNPMSGAARTSLKKWVVNTQTNDSGANMEIPVSPSVLYTGTSAYDNCSSLPANDGAITFMGAESTAYAQNLIYHPNAFGLVFLPLAMPSSVWGSRQTDEQTGVSIRIVKDYILADDEEAIRLDILFGVKCLYPELAVRCWGE